MASNKAEPRPNDVIAAVATAPGRGGIGIVRLSGPGLAAYARRLGNGREPEPRHAGFVRFRDADGRVIDEGLMLYFPAPHSFTGEDVLELQGHGGPVVLRMVLARCVELGARLAEPGEFSQRAFLNGRMDLAQAEAVADLIEASTAAAARSAMRSLGGEFSARIRALCDALIDLRMLVEATLDFPEEEIDFLEKAQAFSRLDDVRAKLQTALDSGTRGRLLREGMRVVLVGRPNVGKSSLLNRLAGEDRAIVTDIPGTTRDALSELIQIDGMPVHVTDTAGLRVTDDPVERIGVERSWREIEQADAVLRLVDAREANSEYDKGIDAKLPVHLPRIVVHNKIDLVPGAAPARLECDGVVHLHVSIRENLGLDMLRTLLAEIAGWNADSENVVLARERHLDAMRRALSYIDTARSHMHELDLFAEDLRLAHDALGEITGEFTPDDLLGEIFSRFCIGK